MWHGADEVLDSEHTELLQCAERNPLVSMWCTSLFSHPPLDSWLTPITLMFAMSVASMENVECSRLPIGKRYICCFFTVIILKNRPHRSHSKISCPHNVVKPFFFSFYCNFLTTTSRTHCRRSNPTLRLLKKQKLKLTHHLLRVPTAPSKSTSIQEVFLSRPKASCASRCPYIAPARSHPILKLYLYPVMFVPNGNFDHPI